MAEREVFERVPQPNPWEQLSVGQKAIYRQKALAVTRRRVRDRYAARLASLSNGR